MAAVSEQTNDYDVIVMGGGAAGLMCAAAAGARGRRVLLLESSNKIGKKILMSGGGRCNFTNLHCDPANYLSANPHFCKSALSRYTQWDFIALVEKHGIAYHEKSLGQLFCDESSKDILSMLEMECRDAQVKILTNAAITSVAKNDLYEVTSDTVAYKATSLVIATGGLSIPKMGATDFGYRLATQFGLQVRETRAGLVPFTFTGFMHEVCERLSGVSLPVKLSLNSATTAIEFTVDALFTHRGLSGPAALQLSSYWQPGDSINIDLLPEHNCEELLMQAKAAQPKAFLRTALTEYLPRALLRELQQLWWPEAADRQLAEFPDKLLRKLAGQFHCWTVKPAATEGYRTAEVTLGGIDTNELSSKTMECKNVPGLFCIGEIVDVTGQLGGFNFQWAWSSAQAAAMVA
jgi:predicted Rossmann fold flavoprotein